jgi:hypothetical protein
MRRCSSPDEDSPEAVVLTCSSRVLDWTVEQDGTGDALDRDFADRPDLDDRRYQEIASETRRFEATRARLSDL